MSKFRFFAAVLVLLLGCEPTELSGVAPTETSTVSQSIVNGTRDPQTVLLTDAEIMAIGWLYPAGSPRDIFCTATLVTPNLVVTARHCTWGASGGDIGFGVGLDPDDPAGTFRSSAVYPNPQADVALILLEEDATAGDLDVTPIAINSEDIDSSVVGRAVQVGGFGDTYDPDRDGRWFATVYVDQVHSDRIVVDGRGEQGLCFGDSGGPLINLDAAGNPVILAVESGGDESCVDQDEMTRLDVVYDWIGPILEGEVPEDPCQGLGSEGRCVDNVAESCRRYELRQTDCTALGTECAYIEDRERYGCTCGELSEIGWCDGDVAETCRDGEYRQMNCGFRGGSCGYSEEDGRYTCIDDPVCRPEDEAGRCDGNTAIRCSNGRTTRELCYADGLVCVETEDGAECVDAGGGDPGAEVDEGDALGFPDVGDMGGDATGAEVEAETTRKSDSGGCVTAPGVPRLRLAWVTLVGILLAARRRSRRGAS